LLREEARVKQYKKIYSETLSALRLAVRVYAEMVMVRELASWKDGDWSSSSSSSSSTSRSATDLKSLSIAKEFHFEEELGDFIPFVQSIMDFDDEELEPLTISPPSPTAKRRVCYYCCFSVFIPRVLVD
jgi:hypothetical protein